MVESGREATVAVPKLKVVVVGAGIAGLATAIAIRRAGHQVEVLERAPVLGAVGAGVVLWPNGQRALEALGISSAGGLAVRGLQFRTPRGRLIAETPIADLRARYGHDLLLLHRTDLHALLLDALGREHVGAAEEVAEVQQDAGAVRIVLASGARREAEILVGADGLRSAVRGHVFGDGEPRYSGATCWRGVASFPIAGGRAINWLGTGVEFGIFPLRDGRAYWFAVANRPEREAEAAGGRRADVLGVFGSWPEPVAAVVQATAEPDVLRNDLYDRPPARTWSRGRITLAGDAAHPMLPNAGQGASQALEDAVALGEALAAHPYRQAFSAYEARRLQRANRFVSQSRATARSIQSSSPIVATVRNLVLGNVPRSLFLNQLDRTIGSG